MQYGVCSTNNPLVIIGIVNGCFVCKGTYHKYETIEFLYSMPSPIISVTDLETFLTIPLDRQDRVSRNIGEIQYEARLCGMDIENVPHICIYSCENLNERKPVLPF